MTVAQVVNRLAHFNSGPEVEVRGLRAFTVDCTPPETLKSLDMCTGCGNSGLHTP